ncbi:unnamed protein product [Zymoseptoria tritici ST99CH_3D1]|uniref:Cytochrome b-c1 complex subunit 8 n=2 Tax=Zymoseptoria tritici TaxID=1047171 RepID=A0A1X7RHP3_ZYMT9|nr:unnamed protein product [Zymoseptoria tritici ST99CH_3D7]SMR42868.1 unnamed protein product [Zymoseptoria tritici ST99CH_1E4]SMR45038.1 unnamed protein product [Zymoseptoria tritici ST99CH_3D1]
MGAQGGVEYSEDVPDNKFSVWCFGHKRIPRTKGTTTYAIAPNRFLYVVPPLVAAYWLMEWANERNHYLNCKAGRALFEQEG